MIVALFALDIVASRLGSRRLTQSSSASAPFIRFAGQISTQAPTNEMIGSVNDALALQTQTHKMRG